MGPPCVVGGAILALPIILPISIGSLGPSVRGPIYSQPRNSTTNTRTMVMITPATAGLTAFFNVVPPEKQGQPTMVTLQDECSLSAEQNHGAKTDRTATDKTVLKSDDISQSIPQKGKQPARMETERVLPRNGNRRMLPILHSL
jgi:hypothetical protein